MVVPLGCLVTPLNAPACELPYEPLKCPVCAAVLNPYCPIDYRNKSWCCVLCNNRSPFPPHYAAMSEQSMPAELFQQYATVEYKVPGVASAAAAGLTSTPTPQMQGGQQPQPMQPQAVAGGPRPAPVFALVVDACVTDEGEVAGLRAAVLLALSKMPDNARVCLITFGATVQIHEISGATEYPRSLVLRGSAEVTPQMIAQQIRHMDRYVCSFADAEFTITSIIEELGADAWPTPKRHRSLRCTGAAISAASSLLQAAAPHTGSLVLTFLSGVCTEGPGKIVETSQSIMLRHHTDVRDKTAAAQHWGPACAFYDKMMHSMVAHGHSLNVFVACLDQVGLGEMKAAVQCSGGMLLSCETWNSEPFKASLARFFKQRHDQPVLEAGLNATFDVITSPTWKVAGVIGQCVGTGKKSGNIADVEVGLGGTCQWTSSLLDSASTFAVYFEPAQAPNNYVPPHAGDNSRYVQFVTRYESGADTRIRVTTLKHATRDKTDFAALAKDFDQLAATVLVARLAIHKTDSTPLFDVLRWLDRTTIRLVSRFGTYQKDQPQSLQLPRELSLYPAFMYHLRRSGALHIFNNSPDETMILRVMMAKVPCDDGVLMIQPALYAYSMSSQPAAVPLDSESVTPDRVLVMDSFYEVVVYNGDMIASWKAMKYDEDPAYAHFAEFLQGPTAHAEALVAARYPTPKLFFVKKNDGNARIILNRINPSRTHTSAPAGGGQQQGGGEEVLTDDVSLAMFMDHLKKLAVQQQQ